MAEKITNKGNSPLEEFGEELISNVRDYTIDQYFRIKKGELKSSQAFKMHENLKEISQRDSKLIDNVIIEIIDRTIHNLLFLFETSEKWDIVAKDLHNDQVSIESVSDGLTGELYSDEGWISKFSKYPTNFND